MNEILNNSKSEDMLEALFFGDSNINYKEVANKLEQNTQINIKKREECVKRCAKDFGINVWSSLEDSTKEIIVSAYLACFDLYRIGGKYNNTIHWLTGSLEEELKKKIFDDFNDWLSDYIEEFTDNFDKEYIEIFKKRNHVPGKVMLQKIEAVGFYKAKGISGELKKFLQEDNWDLELLSDKNQLEKAFKLVNIRNKYAHFIEEEIAKLENFFEARDKTIVVLKWFIDSYNY